MRPGLLAIALACAPALATAEDLVVVAAVSGEPQESVSSVNLWSAIEEVAEHRLGLTVLPIDQPAARVALDSMSACGSAMRCVLERVRPTGADLALVINAALDLRLVSVALIDLRRGEEIEKVEREAGPESLIAQVRAVSGEMLDRAHIEEAARLMVEVRPPEANVRIPSAPGVDVGPPSARRAIKVPPGRHTIEASLAGHVDRTITLDAPGGEDVPVSLVLEADVPLISARRAPWVAIALGAIGAGIGGGVLVSTEADRSEQARELREAQAADGRVSITRAEAEADDAYYARHSTIGGVLLGAGAAVLCGGLTWLWLDAP